jgi:hypothetical protein
MDSVDPMDSWDSWDAGIARSLGKTLNRRSHRGTELVTTFSVFAISVASLFKFFLVTSCLVTSCLGGLGGKALFLLFSAGRRPAAYSDARIAA